MNRAFILTTALISILYLIACQSTPLYKKPQPQIAKTAPNIISNQALMIPTIDTQIKTPPKALQIQAIPATPVKIGILLPLTGKHSHLGQSMLKAAQMALFDLGHRQFEIIPRDTEGKPDVAKKAAKEAINEDVHIILGPLFAASAKAVKPIAQRAGLKILTFSTDWTIAGRNAYVMGFSPFDQVERIISFAASKGIRDIGALVPNTAYGNTVITAYNNSATQYYLNSPPPTRFNPDGGNVAITLRKFTQFDARQIQEQSDITDKSDIQTVIEENLPYEAIFMPMGGSLARSVSNLLSQYDLPPSKVRRLGTGLWDDLSLVTEAAMEGAWFASPDPKAGDKFREKFNAIYGYTPPRLATLAYDATALAGILARNSSNTNGQPTFHHSAITNPNGFAGIDGIFRFNSNGMAERGLAILEYKNGTIRVIDEAPTTFVPSNTYSSTRDQSPSYDANTQGQVYEF